jgi:hypothetical protein
MAVSGFLLVSCSLAVKPTEKAVGSTTSDDSRMPSVETLPPTPLSETIVSPAETVAPTLSKAVIAEPGTALIPPTPIPVLVGEKMLSDDAASKLMSDLVSSESGKVDEALQTIKESDDTRFIAVLLEMMRARQLGIVSGSHRGIIEAMESLSGEEFGQDWPAWVEWYGKTDLVPPPGFTSWKGTILARIDPGFADFLQDGFPSRIRVEEILWGGVAIDGIPPLEHAPMIPGAAADYLFNNEPVFGVVVNDDARAYPLRIVDNHEMANDTIGGVPMSLAYCTLCGAAIAYDGRASNGETYNFGTSGFLYRSNKLMYDRTTRTLWNQLTGEPVLGELADSDVSLALLPVVLTSWGDWLKQHPNTQVLDRETGIYPADFYESGVLYGNYFAANETMFPVWQRSELLEDKDFVYALIVEGIPKAYDVKTLIEEKVVNDSIGDVPLVLIAPRDLVTVNGVHRTVGSVTYTNGGEVRAFNRGDNVFAAGSESDVVLDANGGEWQVTEEGLMGPYGQVAPRINGHLAYWFGWYAFFPNTFLYPDSTSG